jgi:SAM-dependent methyltransferase
MSAARHWAEQLAAWRIPEAILDQAPTSPWILPVELFRVDDREPADSPSHRLAREVLEAGGCVLDIGCGGGRAGFALAPPAATVYGVDAQPHLLEVFATTARARGVRHRAILGTWPDVARDVPVADVAVSHHVAYNVADLGAFAVAAGDHARRRVVLELSGRHPLAHLAPLWRHFWGIERPDGPSARDALAVLLEARLPARITTWQEPGERRPDLPWEQRIEFTRIRLCLPAERDREIAEVLERLGPPAPREVAALWWDVR